MENNTPEVGRPRTPMYWEDFAEYTLKAVNDNEVAIHRAMQRVPVRAPQRALAELIQDMQERANWDLAVDAPEKK